MPRHPLFEDPKASGWRSSTTAARRSPLEKSPVPADRQIRGLGPITISIPELEHTRMVLERVMNMRENRTYEAADSAGTGTTSTVHVFAMGEGGPAAELHVAVEPQLSPARQGRGGVHHVAFRTPDEAQYDAWAKRLREIGVPNSGKVDRFYFRSLYFREPNGILFEIATDGPGFHADEPIATMGERLSLPPFRAAPCRDRGRSGADRSLSLGIAVAGSFAGAMLPVSAAMAEPIRSKPRGGRWSGVDGCLGRIEQLRVGGANEPDAVDRCHGIAAGAANRLDRQLPARLATISRSSWRSTGRIVGMHRHGGGFGDGRARWAARSSASASSSGSVPPAPRCPASAGSGTR